MLAKRSRKGMVNLWEEKEGFIQKGLAKKKTNAISLQQQKNSEYFLKLFGVVLVLLILCFAVSISSFVSLHSENTQIYKLLVSKLLLAKFFLWFSLKAPQKTSEFTNLKKEPGSFYFSDLGKEPKSFY